MDAVSELHLNQNATILSVKVFYLNESRYFFRKIRFYFKQNYY